MPRDSSMCSNTPASLKYVAATYFLCEIFYKPLTIALPFEKNRVSLDSPSFKASFDEEASKEPLSPSTCGSCPWDFVSFEHVLNPLNSGWRLWWVGRIFWRVSSTFVALLTRRSPELPDNCSESEWKDVKSSDRRFDDEVEGRYKVSFLRISAVIFFNSFAEASISAASSVGHPTGAQPADLNFPKLLCPTNLVNLLRKLCFII